tara:strand:+ start:912 stop:1652 length:741 start_codon:yes stop_codon:yes gene_type:complete
MSTGEYLATGITNTETSDQREDVGVTGRTRDGRLWRYGHNASVALVSGHNLSQAAVVANHASDRVVATGGAAGASSIIVTLGSTASTEDYYKNGYLYVNDNGSEGSLYVIATNAATASDGAQTVPIADEGGLTEAITAGTDQVGLIQNLWEDVVVFPTTVTGAPVGLATINVQADYYFWVLVAGVAPARADTAVSVGASIEPSAAYAGGVDLFDRSGSIDAPQIGVCAGVAAVDTEFQLFNFLISA